MQQQAQRVAVFVDVQNMYYSARALYEQKVDFGEILKEAVGDRQLIRAFAYVIRADKEEEENFFDALRNRGYELRVKDLLQFYGGNQKGDWDVGLAMDVVRMVDKVDAIVIVSGDGDFADLLQYAQSRGVHAEVMAFGSSASSALRETADAILDLSADTDKFLIGRRANRPKKGVKENLVRQKDREMQRPPTGTEPEPPTTPKRGVDPRPAPKPKPRTNNAKRSMRKRTASSGPTPTPAEKPEPRKKPTVPQVRRREPKITT